MTIRFTPIPLVVLAAIFAFAGVLPDAANARTWPTWGNTEIPDCTFAAAADWEIAALGYTPPEAQVRNEYLAAAGTSASEGITPSVFAHWWRYHGIGGVRAIMHEIKSENSLYSPGTLPLSADTLLERSLRRYHFLLAHMGWDFGHVILLTGYTVQGLIYVTYGEEREMPWLEWRQQSWGLFRVAVIPLA